MNKSRKGITLIALVITIIVLLILAAVSIAMLSGDNSILRRAKSAVGYNYIGAAKDEVSLAYNSAYAKYLTNRYTEAKTGVDEKNIAKSNEYEVTPVSEVKIAYNNNQEPSYIKIAAVTAEDKNLAKLFAKELKTHVASNRKQVTRMYT